MALPIFYIDKQPEGSLVLLNEETSKHVVQVLRMKEGERLQLTDGQGNLYTTSIASDHKKHCTVTIERAEYFEQSSRRISIAISLLKNNARFEWFLEKATEVGVAEIILLECERTEKHHVRIDRLKNILVAAMLQSQQVWLPALQEPVPFNKAILHSTASAKLIAHCMEGAKSNLTEYKGSESAQILIGPEGDFSPAEINLALAAGYQPVTLGSTRLRTETAGVAAAVLLCI